MVRGPNLLSLEPGAIRVIKSKFGDVARRGSTCSIPSLGDFVRILHIQDRVKYRLFRFSRWKLFHTRFIHQTKLFHVHRSIQNHLLAFLDW